MMLSATEENYIKAIHHLGKDENQVSTNSIADHLNTKAASVSDMLKKLAKKKLVNYQPYMGVTLTESGKKKALLIIRKHRLWEVFLVEQLNFQWDEVHIVAEQLEHVQSQLLIDRLDSYLGYPQIDPHGDPIPDKEGLIQSKPKVLMETLNEADRGRVAGLKETSPTFLQYLDKVGIYIGAQIKVLEVVDFDQSMEIEVDKKSKLVVSKEVTRNIFVSL